MSIIYKFKITSSASTLFTHHLCYSTYSYNRLPRYSLHSAQQYQRLDEPLNLIIHYLQSKLASSVSCSLSFKESVPRSRISDLPSLKNFTKNNGFVRFHFRSGILTHFLIDCPVRATQSANRVRASSKCHSRRYGSMLLFSFETGKLLR